MVAHRGRSHGDDEAARRVGGGGVEADGGEGAAAQGGFSAVEEEARGCRMRPAGEERSEEEERTRHTFYTIEPLAPGENTTRCQKGPKAPVGRPLGANGEP